MEITKETVVVITGASRGIGEEAAVAFAKRGARVVLGARDEGRLEGVARRVRAAGGEPLAVRCDVSREMDCRLLIDTTFKTYGRLNVLVNNAGYGHFAPVELLTNDALEKIFKTNLWGTLWCTQSALAIMKQQKSGHIVDVSTVISWRAIPYFSAYCMTKFAMNAMNEALRQEVRRYGIYVTLVCPGLTASEFKQNTVKVGGYEPQNRGPGMSSEKVGEAIVKAVENRKRRVNLTAGGKILIWLQRFSPSLTDEILGLYARRIAKRANAA